MEKKKGIIEKLGIKPIVAIEKNGSLAVVHAKDIEKLEKQRDELLEALIWQTKALDDANINLGKLQLNAIQKATGKTWEQIKGLLYE